MNKSSKDYCSLSSFLKLCFTFYELEPQNMKSVLGTRSLTHASSVLRQLRAPPAFQFFKRSYALLSSLFLFASAVPLSETPPQFVPSLHCWCP